MTTPPSGGVGPVVRRTVNPAMITSDFESQSHEQLRAMIESADPAATRALGDRLKTAGVAIGKIGEDLRTYMSHVNWEGEAGDAFRTWGANMVNATTRLGEFSDKAGTWMGHAAETLSTVKSAMPEYSATSKATLNSYLSQHPGGFLLKPPATSDAPKPGAGVLAGPTPEAATAAQKRLDEDHAEAVRLMRQLAGSYVWSAHNMGEVERPQFQPLPPDVVPPTAGPRDTVSIGQDAGPGTPGTPGAASGAARLGLREAESGTATSPLETTAKSARNGYTELPTASGHQADPVAHAGTEIAGGTALAQVPTAAQQTPTGPAPGGTEAVPTGAYPPNVGPVPPLKGGGTVPARGDGRVPPAPQGGPVSGEAQRMRVMPSVPSLPGDGVVGGRPMPHGADRPVNQSPRGAVFGGESPTGRPPVAHGPGPLTGPGNMSGPRGGVFGGRRVASEAGGVVAGGTHPRTVRPTDGAFTPGGTGLVRGSALPSGFHGGVNRNDRRERELPGYLVEDDETWEVSRKRVVPPVVD